VLDVYLEGSAANDIRRLPKDVSDRVIDKIRALASDPHPPGCRKIVGSKDDWRLRIGAYRVIYEVDEQRQRVNIMRVKHRRDAYR
jgi:mRNA interferase RelE/StbE